MSSSSDEEIALQHTSSEMQFIAEELKNYPSILEKSQLPKVKRMKDEAIEKVLTKYKAVFGKEIDSKILMKKVNNMKTRMKKKTDLKKTGNKKIKLVEWEKIMFTAMSGTSNPTINKIPGATEIGIRSDTHQLENLDTPNAHKHDDTIVETSFTQDRQPLPRKRGPTDKYETTETRDLDMKALQRLVLLEQLKTTRIQGEYFKNKLERLNNSNFDYIANMDVIDNENTFVIQN